MRDVRKIAMIMKKEQQAERKRRESTAMFTEVPQKAKFPFFET